MQNRIHQIIPSSRWRSSEARRPQYKPIISLRNCAVQQFDINDKLPKYFWSYHHLDCCLSVYSYSCELTQEKLGGPLAICEPIEIIQIETVRILGTGNLLTFLEQRKLFCTLILNNDKDESKNNMRHLSALGEVKEFTWPLLLAMHWNVINRLSSPSWSHVRDRWSINAVNAHQPTDASSIGRSIRRECMRKCLNA